MKTEKKPRLNRGYRRAYPRVTKPFTADACRFCSALTAIGDASQVIVADQAGNITIGGQRPDDALVQELATEVSQFRRMRLGQLLTATAREKAVRMGINDATSYDHLLIAKAMLYVADLNGSVLAAIENENKRRLAAKEAVKPKS